MPRQPRRRPEAIAPSARNANDDKWARRREFRQVGQDGPDPVDRHVGARLRLRRCLLGMTQGDLAAAIGLTFQQVQKYEKAANRVSASMLHRIAGVLAVPVGFFFDDLSEDMTEGAVAATNDNVLARPEAGDLLRGYYRLSVPARRAVHDLVKALGRGVDDQG